MIKLIRAIRKKYFDDTVDLSKLSKTFLLWGVGLVLVYIANIYLTRLIGLQQYGEYTIFMNWVALVSTLVTFGWDGYLVQKIPQLPVNGEGKISAGSMLKKALLSFFILYALLCLLLFAGVYLVKFPLLFSGTGTLLIFLLFVFLFTGISYFKSILKIFNKVTPVQWLEDISKPLLLLIIVGCFYYFKKTLTLSAVYLVNVGLFFVVLLGLYLLMYQTVRKKIVLKSNSPVREKWVRQCFYFMCIMLGYTFFSKMELLFLGFYAKNEDAARYQLLLRIADLVILPDFLFNYYLPQKFSHFFAEKNYTDSHKLFRNAARTIFILQVICLMGVAAIGYFYLQSFKIASPAMYVLLLILCSSQLFYSLFGSTNLVLMTSGNEKYSFMALGMVLIVEAIANILFIPAYGLPAAVYISWGSVLAYTMILYLFVHKKLKFSSPLISFRS